MLGQGWRIVYHAAKSWKTRRKRSGAAPVKVFALVLVLVFVLDPVKRAALSSYGQERPGCILRR
jgi:hypothetical protein